MIKVDNTYINPKHIIAIESQNMQDYPKMKSAIVFRNNKNKSVGYYTETADEIYAKIKQWMKDWGKP